MNGVDIKCRANSVVQAPFDGDMYFWRPFGGNKDYKCADQGVRIEGTGQWQGSIRGLFNQTIAIAELLASVMMNVQQTGCRSRQMTSHNNCSSLYEAGFDM